MESELQKGVSERNRNTKKEYQNGIGTPKRSIRMESEHQQTYDLIPHMTYFL